MRAALGCLAGVCLLGCSTVHPHSQLVTIEPIHRPSAKEAQAALPGLGSSAPKDCEKVPDTGSWFVRKVMQPDGDSRKLYALEIIYCPTDKLVFSECRVAVVWARDGKGSLGPQVGAPPSPVKEKGEEATTEAAPSPSSPSATPAPSSSPSPAPAPSPDKPAPSKESSPARTTAPAAKPAPSRQASSSSAPAPPTPAPKAEPAAPGPNDPVAVKGRKYAEISAGDLTRLRNWIWKPISVSLKKGKPTFGQLRSYDPAGIQLDNPTDLDAYTWTEIESIAPSTAHPSPAEAPAAKPAETSAQPAAQKEPAKSDGSRRPVAPPGH